MAKRTRASTLRRRIPGHSTEKRNVIRASRIKSVSGEWTGCRNVANCSVVVLQTRGRTEEKPTTVVWHAYYPHVRVFYERGEAEGHPPPAEKPITELLEHHPRLWNNDAGLRSRLQRKFINRLRRGHTTEPVETHKMPPEAIIDSIINYLERRPGGDSIKATVIPGAVALDEKQWMTYKTSKFAFDRLHEILKERRRRGRIHIVEADKDGALHVHVSPRGRVFRDRVAKRREHG